MNGPEEGRDSSPPARASPVPQGPEAANSSSNIMVARWASGIGRSPTGPPPLPGGVGSGETDNNNKSTVGESLLSQALEKHSPAAMIRSSLVGDLAAAAAAGGNRDDSASDAASDKPESIMDGLIKSSVDSPADSLHRHLTSPSPAAAAAAAAAAANPLFPPGLEALYRQAGFPSAFLGLAAGAAASAAGSEGGSGGSTGRGGGSGGERGSSGPTSSSPNAPPPGIIPGLPPTTQHGGLQSHAGNPNRKIIGFFPVKVYKTNYFLFFLTVAGKLDMMRVRATDPRPCPKCGKIYRSAHTLRTHMEDKHTVCPGYRCVLCGTVAKSRNSLHSHMSRQHRGISTKDLPVMPMPTPFDADLASRLLAKAGVKVTPNELAARASPTAPRRSDLPKLDSNLLTLQQQQFPLPPTLPTSMASSMMRAAAAANHHRESGEFEERRSAAASPFGGANGGGGPGSGPGSAPALSPSPRGGLPPPLGALTPKDFAALAAGPGGPGSGGPPPPAGMGSALLDTYLSMIAAAGGADAGAMAAALNFQNRAALAAASMAAAGGGGGGSSGSGADLSLASSASPPLRTNGSGGLGGLGAASKEGDEEGSMHAGELGSDAENEDDLSDGDGADKQRGSGGGGESSVGLSSGGEGQTAAASN